MSQASVVKDQLYLEHKPGHTHPEHPHRLRSIYRMLEKDFVGDLNVVEPVMASLDQIELVHTSTYIKKVLKTAEHNFTSLAPDTPASAELGSHEGILVACGITEFVEMGIAAATLPGARRPQPRTDS